jgi:predicted dienelactone hydrolase
MTLSLRTIPVLAFVIVLVCNSLQAASAADVLLHDTRRNRDVPLKVYYPSSGSGSFPLIIFSHGFGGTKDGYEYLGKGWADAGYVVILPTHIGSDHDAFLQVGGKTARDPGSAFDLQRQRAADISFILSWLDLIEQRLAGIRGKIDRERIGVAGHSMGAGTAMLIGGATASSPGGPVESFRDERVKAVVAMSPQGAGEEGFGEHSWDHVEIPVMTMSGTADGGINGEPPSWRVQPFEHMPGGEKYQVTVEGAEHLSFAIGVRFHLCVLRETTAFWDAYLKGDHAAKQKIANLGSCEVKSK